jgi:hypothetical protein
MVEQQNYLAGGGAEENRTLGSTLVSTYELGRYKPSVDWTYITYDASKPDPATMKIEEVRDPKSGQDAKPVPLDTKDNALRLNFSDTKRPGVYVFKLVWVKRDTDPANAPPTKDEYVATVFNFDTEKEGDLRRTSSDDFTAVAEGATVHAFTEDYGRELEQRPTDMSSGRWIFLVILLVLVFEQAMAVRLSYHRKADDLEAYAPSAAAAMAGRTAVPVGDVERAPAPADPDDRGSPAA